MLQWDVYICQSKACIERGAAITLDSFISLAPSSQITVHPAILTKIKSKGPNIICIPRKRTSTSKPFEVNNVDSVDKVCRILTQHLSILNITSEARNTIHFYHKGNSHLERNEISEAIHAYDKSLAYDESLCPGFPKKEGYILLMRATAYLQRAFQHQDELKEVVIKLREIVPDAASLGSSYATAMDHPTLSLHIFTRLLSDCKRQEFFFRQIKFHHGLYEFALLHAARDSLRATQILTHNANAMTRAAEILAKLRKFFESSKYYEKAIELDPELETTLSPIIDDLKNQEVLVVDSGLGWHQEILRLALDVAG